MQRISYLGWWVLLFALILSSCGKLERKGPEPVNMIPEVFFTNVPEEGLKFSISPRIYWYGTDKDGFIVAYQYAVIRDSVIELWGDLSAAKDSLKIGSADSASWVNNTARLDAFGAHVAAEGGHQRNVRMYAEMDPEDSTAQHIFLQAVDNMGGLSEIKTRMFWRNNHTPQCSLEVDSTFPGINFYCLPETTQTWKGIFISWIGLDTLDYPDKRKQPDLYYKWELWGPYADTLLLDDDKAAMVDSSLDSIEIGGAWFYDRWILDKSHIFKNLENYPDSGYGWYHLRVWSRDDAFVRSDDSAATFFRILKPLFRFEEPSQKTILVLDHTVYGGDIGASTPTDVWPFYHTALSRIDDLYDNYNIDSLGKQLPSEDSLSRYDLVIVLNFGRDRGITDDSYLKYKNYMNVGGRLWIMGLNNYGVSAGRKIHYFAEMRIGAPNTCDVATEYLGLEGVFFSEYSPAEPERLEFIGVEPFGSWGFPSLKIDPVKAAKLKGYNPNKEGQNFPVNGIPHVCYDVISASVDFDKRAALQRRLYSFISRRGPNSEMNQMPSATTYIGPTFRTAAFAFPLSIMKDGDEENPGAHETFRKMVEWFWEDLPEP